MKYIIKDTSVVIVTDNHKVEIPKNNFNKLILNEPILQELSFEDLLELWKNLYGIPKNVKDILKKKIELYSNSFSVKSFIYKGKEYWLDKDNRSSLWNLSNSSLSNVEFVVGDDILTMNSLKLKAFLLKLEVYSYKCFVNTFKHLKASRDLSKLEDIINYDYTTSYPEKVTLE